MWYPIVDSIILKSIHSSQSICPQLFITNAAFEAVERKITYAYLRDTQAWSERGDVAAMA